jgi:hypothetical protein
VHARGHWRIEAVVFSRGFLFYFILFYFILFYLTTCSAEVEAARKPPRPVYTKWPTSHQWGQSNLPAACIQWWSVDPELQDTVCLHISLHVIDWLIYWLGLSGRSTLYTPHRDQSCKPSVSETMTPWDSIPVTKWLTGLPLASRKMDRSIRDPWILY